MKDHMAQIQLSVLAATLTSFLATPPPLIFGISLHLIMIIFLAFVVLAKLVREPNFQYSLLKMICLISPILLLLLPHLQLISESPVAFYKVKHLLLGSFTMVSVAYTSDGHLKSILRFLFVTAFLLCVFGMLKYLLNFGINFNHPFLTWELGVIDGPSATFGSINRMANYICLVLPFWVILEEKYGILTYVSLTFMIATIAFIGSRSAMLASMVEVIVVPFLFQKHDWFKNTRKAFYCFLLGLTVGFALTDLGSKTWRIFTLIHLPDEKVMEMEKKNTTSLGIRSLMMKKGLEMVKEKPFFGHGPEGFHIRMEKEGYVFEKVSRVHNLLLEILIEFGAASLIILAALAYLLVRSCKKTRENRIISLSLLIYPFSSLGLSQPLYFLPFWALLGLMLSEKFLANRPITKNSNFKASFEDPERPFV